MSGPGTSLGTPALPGPAWVLLPCLDQLILRQASLDQLILRQASLDQL